MAIFKVFKTVASLPEPLEADAVYFVRAGAGFDLYVSDSTGSIAHKVNADVDTGSLFDKSMTVPYGPSDACLFVESGQSNAEGFSPLGSALPTMTNVHGLARATNRSFSISDVTWSAFEAGSAFSLGRDYDVEHAPGMTSIGIEFARLWQEHISAGNTSGLPDLYIIRVPWGAQGIGIEIESSDKRWNIDDIGLSLGIEGLAFLQQYVVHLALNNLYAQGKTVRVIGNLWVQGETDGYYQAAAEKYEPRLTKLFESLDDVAGVVMPTYDVLESTDLATGKVPYQDIIRTAKTNIASKRENAFLIDPTQLSMYDAGGTNSGIFNSDNIHYRTAALEEMAQILFDKVVTEGNLGVVAMPALFKPQQNFLDRMTPSSSSTSYVDAPAVGSIAGNPDIGETLSVDFAPGYTATGYQWFSNGSPVATTSTYVIDAADEGNDITVSLSGITFETGAVVAGQVTLPAVTVNFTGLHEISKVADGEYSFDDATGVTNPRPYANTASSSITNADGSYVQGTFKTLTSGICIFALSRINSSTGYDQDDGTNPYNFMIFNDGNNDWLVNDGNGVLTQDTLVPAAQGDVMRLIRESGSWKAQVSKDGGETFTTIYTFSGLPASSVYYPALFSIGNVNGNVFSDIKMFSAG